MEEQGLQKIPDLRLAQQKFSLSLPENKNDETKIQELKKTIIDNSK